MSEIKIHGKHLRDVLMRSEFLAIIGRDAFKSGYPLEQFNDGFADQLTVSGYAILDIFCV